jgi:hypothetical protein
LRIYYSHPELNSLRQGKPKGTRSKPKRVQTAQSQQVAMHSTTLLDPKFTNFLPPWDTPVQQALLKNTAIQKAEEAEGKACGGKATGSGNACVQADRNLNSAIVAAVRKGIELPTPERIP